MTQVKLIDQEKPYGQNVNRLEEGFHELEVHDIQDKQDQGRGVIAIGWVEYNGGIFAVTQYASNNYFQQIGPIGEFPSTGRYGK